MKKVVCFVMIFMLAAGAPMSAAYAESSAGKAGLKSLVVPGWGQYQNGEFDSKSGRVKVGIMAAVEVAAIVTTAVVGGVVGYPVVWVGIGLFIANHTWSALDAFIHYKESPSVNLGTQPPGEKVGVVR